MKVSDSHPSTLTRSLAPATDKPVSPTEPTSGGQPGRELNHYLAGAAQDAQELQNLGEPVPGNFSLTWPIMLSFPLGDIVTATVSGMGFQTSFDPMAPGGERRSTLYAVSLEGPMLRNLAPELLGQAFVLDLSQGDPRLAVQSAVNALIANHLENRFKPGYIKPEGVRVDIDEQGIYQPTLVGGSNPPAPPEA